MKNNIILKFPSSRILYYLSISCEVLFITLLLTLGLIYVGHISLIILFCYIFSIKKILYRTEIIMNPEGVIIRDYSYLSSETKTYQWKRVKQIIVSRQSSRQYPYGTMEIFLCFPKENVVINLDQIFDIRAKIPVLRYNKITKESISNICKSHSVHFYWFE